MAAMPSPTSPRKIRGRGGSSRRVYEVVGPEDKNVDFGDTYTPSLLLLPPTCAGASTPVPQYLSLFPGTLHPYYDPESTQFKRA